MVAEVLFNVEGPSLEKRRASHLGQENSHHDDDEGHGRAAVFYQLDEAFIGRLMRRIVVAVSSGIGHFAMVRHHCPRKIRPLLWWPLQQSRTQGNGARWLVIRTFRRASCP